MSLSGEMIEILAGREVDLVEGKETAAFTAAMFLTMKEEEESTVEIAV